MLIYVILCFIMEEETDHLTKIGFTHCGLAFPQRSCTLHILPSACGLEKITSTEYDWNGQHRGKKPFAILQYTIAGEGRLWYERTEYRLEPGKAMLVMIPHEHRYFFPREIDEWKFIYVCLTGREALRLCRYIIDQKSPVFKLEEDGDTIKEMRRLVEQAHSGGINSPNKSSAAGYSIIMALLDEIFPVGKSVDLPIGIQCAIDYCRRNFTGKIKIDKLAEVAGYSRYHFTRQFKLYAGVTPVQYIAELRLKEAISWLRETSAPLKEIAPRCGFPDGNYLCRVFHNSYGITPGEFRRSGMYI